MSRMFSIIGDGNVRRNMTGLNVASRECMKSAQVIDYVAPGSLDDAFKEIRPESTVCIFAALTDLLLTGGDSGTIFAAIDPILDSFRSKAFSLCTSRPNLEVNHYYNSWVTYIVIILCHFTFDSLTIILLVRFRNFRNILILSHQKIVKG